MLIEENSTIGIRAAPLDGGGPQIRCLGHTPHGLHTTQVALLGFSLAAQQLSPYHVQPRKPGCIQSAGSTDPFLTALPPGAGQEPDVAREWDHRAHGHHRSRSNGKSSSQERACGLLNSPYLDDLY